jgi:hypothetical protein
MVIVEEEKNGKVSFFAFLSEKKVFSIQRN